MATASQTYRGEYDLIMRADGALGQVSKGQICLIDKSVERLIVAVHLKPLNRKHMGVSTNPFSETLNVPSRHLRALGLDVDRV